MLHYDFVALIAATLLLLAAVLIDTYFLGDTGLRFFFKYLAKPSRCVISNN